MQINGGQPRDTVRVGNGILLNSSKNMVIVSAGVYRGIATNANNTTKEIPETESLTTKHRVLPPGEKNLLFKWTNEIFQDGHDVLNMRGVPFTRLNWCKAPELARHVVAVLD